MVDVRTIGAGGGSVAWIDKGGLLRVGPRVARVANPGPACYGRGGARADRDRRQPRARRHQPRLLPRRRAVARRRGGAAALGTTLGAQLAWTIEEVAAAIIELVDFNMVNAIRLVSIDRGLDPRDFTLVSFGGAVLAARRRAGRDHRRSRDVLVPIHQGVFSAFGLMTADMRVDESVTASFRSDLITSSGSTRSSAGCGEQRAARASQPRATTARRCSSRPSRCATSGRTTASTSRCRD